MRLYAGAPEGGWGSESHCIQGRCGQGEGQGQATRCQGRCQGEGPVVYSKTLSRLQQQKLLIALWCGHCALLHVLHVVMVGLLPTLLYPCAVNLPLCTGSAVIVVLHGRIRPACIWPNDNFVFSCRRLTLTLQWVMTLTSNPPRPRYVHVQVT